jgi:hypothetical protein
MVICCSLLVAKSLAVTCTIPLTSISNLTSILRNTPWAADGIPSKLEATKSYIMLGHFSFTLQNMNINRSLVISCSGKYLAFGCRYSSITLYNPGKHSTQGFNPKDNGVTSR